MMRIAIFRLAQTLTDQTAKNHDGYYFRMLYEWHRQPLL